MDKLICTLMIFVVLCVLPKYCDLRSVKDGLNYDVMDGMKNGVDLMNLKKRHSITIDKKVPVVQPRLQKQIQQDEKTIKKSVKQNIKTGKQDVQKPETKTRGSDSTTLLHPSKHSAQNPKVTQHKIKPRQGLEEDAEAEDDDIDEYDAEFEDVNSEVLAKKKVIIEKQDKNIDNKKTKLKGTAGNVVKTRYEKPAKPVGRTKAVNSPEEKKQPAPIEVAEVCEEDTTVPPAKKVAKLAAKPSAHSKGSHKKH